MSNDANCHSGQFARFVQTSDILHFVFPVILASGTHHLTAGGEVAVEDFGEGQCKIYAFLVVWFRTFHNSFSGISLSQTCRNYLPQKAGSVR